MGSPPAELWTWGSRGAGPQGCYTCSLEKVPRKYLWGAGAWRGNSEAKSSLASDCRSSPISLLLAYYQQFQIILIRNQRNLLREWILKVLITRKRIFFFFVSIRWMLTNLIMATISQHMKVKSLHCAPQTCTMLYVNYISVKLKNNNLFIPIGKILWSQPSRPIQTINGCLDSNSQTKINKNKRVPWSNKLGKC